MSKHFTGFLFLGLLIGLMIGCTPGPDLIPIGKDGLEGSISFCNLEDGELVVNVKNIGNADAQASTTVVSFGNLGSQSQNTPPIPVGSSTTVNLKIPTGCFNPDCSFEITVDGANDVTETSTGEGNNTEQGHCIG